MTTYISKMVNLHILNEIEALVLLAGDLEKGKIACLYLSFKSALSNCRELLCVGAVEEAVGHSGDIIAYGPWNRLIRGGLAVLFWQ